MTSMIRVNARLIAAAMLYVGRNPTRVYLNALRVEVTKKLTRVISTDGYCLFYGTDRYAEGPTCQRNIQVSNPAKFTRLCKRNDSTYVDFHDSSVVVHESENSGVSFEAEQVETFPAWRKVFAKSTDDCDLTPLNPDFLVRAGQVGQIMGCQWTAITRGYDGRPTSFLYDQNLLGIGAEVLVMPMRITEHEERQLKRSKVAA